MSLSPVVVLSPFGDGDFDRLSRDRLEMMTEAALEATSCLRALGKTGHNLVGEVLAGHGTFLEWSHYPPGDAQDPEFGSQYYYHAHPPQDRLEGEHGHFHLFVRAGSDGEPATHLFAISMNRVGLPTTLFTTNRWVTAERWRPASEVVTLLGKFRIEHTKPNWALNRWISAIPTLFWPQIVDLLSRRDHVIAEHRAHHPEADVFEDRQLQVCSSCQIDVGHQAQLIERALARTG